MKTFNKTLLALSLAGLGMGSAQAQQFYVDLDGTGVGNGFADATNCATCTADADEITFAYQSETVITLGDGSLDVGDTIITTGGLNVGDFASNHATGLIPLAETFGFSSTASTIALDWGLSFDMTLSGTVAATDGSSVSEVAYTSGLINVFLVKFDGLGAVASTTNIMDLVVTGSDASNPSNFIITGMVNFDDVEDYTDMFHLEGSSCMGDNSFSAIAACPMTIDFIIDQNLNDAIVTVGDGVNGVALGDVLLEGNHDGSLEFASAVPVPAAAWLFGSGLLGLIGVARRKKA